MEFRTQEQIQKDKELGQDEASGISDPRAIYYGPHACDKCGKMICRLALEQGGEKFDYPEGPVYPNSKWNPHICVVNEPA